jgi:hypothetical protein
MPLGSTIQGRWKRSRANFRYRRLPTVPPERLAVGPSPAPVLHQVGGQDSDIPVGGAKNEPIISAHIWPAINHPLLYLL